MAEDTLIAWTDYTFNPWIGCSKVSAGCQHCYAERLVTGKMGMKNVWGPAPDTPRARTSAANWAKVSTWHRKAATAGERKRVFCGSLMDFWEDHPTPNALRLEVFDIIRRTPNLDWLLLTKRPENIQRFLPADWGQHGWPNVWLGATIEANVYVKRAKYLTAIPAVVRFVSYEPAVGPLDKLSLAGLDWIIYGGESGPGYRPHDLAWPRDMRDRCAAQGVAFFYKQSPAPRTEMGTTLDGETVRMWPVVRLAE